MGKYLLKAYCLKTCIWCCSGCVSIYFCHCIDLRFFYTCFCRFVYFSGSAKSQHPKRCPHHNSEWYSKYYLQVRANLSSVILVGVIYVVNFCTELEVILSLPHHCSWSAPLPCCPSCSFSLAYFWSMAYKMLQSTLSMTQEGDGCCVT